MTSKAPTTAYALLGLLSLKPWTTYELVRQTERSLHWFFPRAERGVYEVAKQLVNLGWAATNDSPAGRRRGTTYRITAHGRRALHTWLTQRGAPLQLESEQLLRVFFADRTRLDDIRASIAAMDDDARAALGQLGAMASHWETQNVPFPDRAPTNAVAMRLITDLHRTITHWAQWADGALDQIERGDEPARRLADDVYTDIAIHATAAPPPLTP